MIEKRRTKGEGCRGSEERENQKVRKQREEEKMRMEEVGGSR